MKKWKWYLLIFCFSFQLNAEIVNPSEQELEQDMGFKVESVNEDRKIANEASESEDSERSVASEGEENSGTIQYWKY